MAAIHDLQVVVGSSDAAFAFGIPLIPVLETTTDLARIRGCSLVPTMGALHDGHASLIRAACDGDAPPSRAGAASGGTRAETDRAGASPGETGAKRSPVVVTIFVNPTQFGPNEDFARYPRTLDSDLRVAEQAGADAVFVPSVETVYPRGLEAAQREAAAMRLPPAATEPALEDRIRPGHFGGVCLVVARLFELCAPKRAYFGEKDWQQLRVIAQMVEQERHRAPERRRFEDLEIVPCPTVRESDGLAMSSRNRYLDAAARHRATALWRAIERARARLRAAASAPQERGTAARAVLPVATPMSITAESLAEVERSMTALLEREGFSVDYAVIREAMSLRPLRGAVPAESMRILLAARLGEVRLIDNAAGGPDEGIA